MYTDRFICCRFKIRPQDTRLKTQDYMRSLTIINENVLTLAVWFKHKFYENFNHYPEGEHRQT